MFFSESGSISRQDAKALSLEIKDESYNKSSVTLCVFAPLRENIPNSSAK
jgi:hypothetical protein